ncbi:MAG: DUF1993 domain-containing protein [Rhizobiales bacterium]|nr:DUF1993 domain-containing protein [Hyphomicrobiales bacterium]MBI3674022.1 DUF1993 domain-containing protein [Hyphomicrobiales bacterium]
MPDAVHALSIGTMARGLRSLAGVLDKSEVHAKAHGIELDVLLQARLYPNMYSLLQQLQYSCYLPCDYAKHFADAAPPRVGYDETTWEQCRKGLDTAVAYLETVTPARVAERSGKVVPLFFDGSRTMNVIDYAARILVPDFFFHMTAAYCILRHNGVPLSKGDFLKG